MSPVTIVRWIALAVAIVAAFVTFPYSGLVMVVAGILLGAMGVSSDDRMFYLIGAMALAQVAGALGAIPAVGDSNRLLHFWLAEALPGEARPASPEVAEVRWVTLAELRGLEPVFGEDIAVIERFAVGSES